MDSAFTIPESIAFLMNQGNNIENMLTAVLLVKRFRDARDACVRGKRSTLE